MVSFEWTIAYIYIKELHSVNLLSPLCLSCKDCSKNCTVFTGFLIIEEVVYTYLQSKLWRRGSKTVKDEYDKVKQKRNLTSINRYIKPHWKIRYPLNLYNIKKKHIKSVKKSSHNFKTVLIIRNRNNGQVTIEVLTRLRQD